MEDLPAAVDMAFGVFARTLLACWSELHGSRCSEAMQAPKWQTQLVMLNAEEEIYERL
jgi:hypothetical protein